MNEHSKRLIGNILNSIRSYELKKITERELMQDIEGTCGAIDEHDIQDELYRFIAKIEDSRYLYGVEEGRSFLLKEIRELKNSMLDDQSGLLMGFDEVEHLEKQVMEKILAGGDEVLEILREQYKGAVVTERWFSGVGFFSTFKVDEKSPRLDCLHSIQITDVDGQIDELTYGVGFILFIRDGIMATLEGVTYADEKWPEHLANLRLCYLPENPADTRDMEDLRRKWCNDPTA